MKKGILFVCFAISLFSTARAQLSKAGIPAGMALSANVQVPQHHYASPDYQRVIKARNGTELSTGVSRPYLVAINVPLQISFPESGVFTKTADGQLVWRAIVEIAGAKGIGLYYDKFHLPQGVRYFLSNGNEKQLIGAYTSDNNLASGLFAHEPLQGDLVRLELNIDAKVDLSNISLHINKAAWYFSGIDYLNQYGREDQSTQLLNFTDSVLYGSNSICMIDATCAVGGNYFNQRRSALSIVVPDEDEEGYGLCSANMINTVGNPVSGCKNYLMTASHCDYENSTSKDRFDQALFRFNYERPCNKDTIPEANTLLGAFFIARSEFDTVNFIIKGDFLLLRLMETIPEAWNVALAGWNRDSTISVQETTPRKFISFHHPLGDVKKVSAGQMISSANFSLGTSTLSHWNITFNEGYVTSGSSGAGLFNGEGDIIGTLTGAKGGQEIASCNLTVAGDTMDINMLNNAYFSKLSYSWSNSDTMSKKLQPWLDPLNSGVLKISGVKANCTPLDTTRPVSIKQIPLDEGILVYPNPTEDGMVFIKFNRQHSGDINLQIFDITGRRWNTFNMPHIRSATYQLSLADLPNGVYLLRITDGQQVSSKKIIVRRR